MTDKELMQQALDALEVATTPLAKDRQEVLRAQAALRERLAQPEQYPVAWKQAILATTDQCAALIQERDELQQQVWRYEKHGVTCQTYRHKVEQSCSECNVRERYAPTPPPRQWQGLSPFDKTLLRTTYAPMKPLYYDKENDHSVCAEVVTDWDSFFAAIESKLQERNP